jgi:hypothetical protein
MLGPAEITTRGEKLNKDKYQQQYELSHAGKFLAIDVTTPGGAVYLADSPEEALGQPKGAIRRVCFISSE